ncbi:MAG TPA: hypothetical protein VNZ45_02575 [Bacteroidia bacterium]|jgi:hypothetical protein|nr:hypothetical protein [Bacteroidia bacterium]
MEDIQKWHKLVINIDNHDVPLTTEEKMEITRQLETVIEKYTCCTTYFDWKN